MMDDPKILGPGDEATLEAFLLDHADFSMFLRANLSRAGLTDRGEVYQGTYAAVVRAGEVRAVAAHYWNGFLVMQAPDHLADVVGLAVRGSGRPVKGLSGPFSQVEAALEALGLVERAAGLDAAERHYALDLQALLVPEPLSAGRLLCRAPRQSELDLLTDWRVAYEIEALQAAGGPALRRACAKDIRRAQDEARQWVLEADGNLVAYSMFNAALPDIVQVGGVWTPPTHRGRGFGRAVVAGSLIAARRQDVRRAILFSANPQAERAYRALGFQVVGDYGLMILPDP